MQIDPASFRDPSGFVFAHNGTLYRHVAKGYAPHYRQLMTSGLYELLVKENLLIPHTEIDGMGALTNDAYKVLQPRLVPFISYPYEWSFLQLKHAALLTLDIQKTSLDYGMTLKDATPTNVQFIGCRPVFIDTLSFEQYTEGMPWVAYRQFCEMFLAPLLLAAFRDETLLKMQRVHHRGIDLKQASNLLPWTTYLRPSITAHIHLHAWLQHKYASTSLAGKEGHSKHTMSKRALYGLIDNLHGVVSRLNTPVQQTEWGNYYSDLMYSTAAFDQKRALVQEIVRKEKPRIVWDLGANAGEFSIVASGAGATVVALDIDHAAIGKLYRLSRAKPSHDILPLVMDLGNPSPALGWAHSENKSLAERGPADLALALALIHHLAITYNLPFERIASYFASLTTQLLIEYVPKDDVNVRRLLASRKDIFSTYTQNCFERAFEQHFVTVAVHTVGDSGRALYHMKKRG